MNWEDAFGDPDEVRVAGWIINRRTKQRRRDPASGITDEDVAKGDAYDTRIRKIGFGESLKDMGKSVAAGALDIPIQLAEGANWIVGRDSTELDLMALNKLEGWRDAVEPEPAKLDENPIQAILNASSRSVPIIAGALASKNPTTIGTALGVMGGGQSHKQMLERGVDPGTARALSYPVAIGQGLAGGLGFGKALKVGKAIPDAARAALRGSAPGAAEGAISELLQIGAEKIGGAKPLPDDLSTRDRVLLSSLVSAIPAAGISAATSLGAPNLSTDAEAFADRFVPPERRMRDRLAAKLEGPERRQRTQFDAMTGLRPQGAWKAAKIGPDGKEVAGEYTGAHKLAAEDPSASVVVWDGDGVKASNDAFGMAVSDELIIRPGAQALKQVAEEFGVSPRLLFRAGGDENAAIVPNEIAEAFAARLEEITPRRLVETPDGRFILMSGTVRSGPDFEAAKHLVTEAKKDKPGRGMLIPGSSAKTMAQAMGIRPVTLERALRGELPDPPDNPPSTSELDAEAYLKWHEEASARPGFVRRNEPLPDDDPIAWHEQVAKRGEVNPEEAHILNWIDSLTRNSTPIEDRPIQTGSKKTGKGRSKAEKLAELEVEEAQWEYFLNPPEVRAPAPPSVASPIAPPPTGPPAAPPPVVPATPPPAGPPPGRGFAAPLIGGGGGPAGPGLSDLPGLVQNPPPANGFDPARPSTFERVASSTHGVPAYVTAAVEQGRGFKKALKLSANMWQKDFTKAARKAAAQTGQSFETLMANAHQVLEGKIAWSAVPESLHPLLSQAREMTRSIGQDLVNRGFLDEQTFRDNENTYQYLAYAAHSDPQWLQKVRGTPLWDKARAQIAATQLQSADLQAQINAGALTPDQAQRQASLRAGGILETMLSSPDQILKAKQNLGSVGAEWIKRRQNLSPEIKAVLGEARSPIDSMQRLVEYGARTLGSDRTWRMIEELGVDRDFFRQPMEGASDALPGAPRELYATKELRSALDAAFQSAATDAGHGLLGAANRYTKRMAVLWNPPSAAHNALSNILAVVGSGNVTPGMVPELWRAAKIAGAATWARGDAAAREGAIDALRHGVIDNAIHVGDLRRYSTEPGGVLGKAARAVDRVAGKVFEYPDNVLKTALWLNERKKLAWTSGKPFTSDEVKVRAAETVNQITANYNRIPLWAQKLRDSPVIGPFVPWVASTLHATLNTAKVAGEEIRTGARTKNAKLQLAGVHRLGSLMGALSAPFIAASAGTAVLNTLKGGDPGLEGWDEESDKAMRSLLWDWQKHAVLIPSSADSGNLTLWDGSYVNYYDIVSGSVAAAARGEDLNEVGTNAVMAIGQKLFSPELGVAMARDAYDAIRSEQRLDLKAYKLLDLALVRYGPLRIPGRMVRAKDNDERFIHGVHAVTGMRPTMINVTERAGILSAQAKAQRLKSLQEIQAASYKMGLDAPGVASLTVRSSLSELEKLYAQADERKRAVLRFGGSIEDYNKGLADIGTGGKALLGGAPPAEAAKIDLEQWLARQRENLHKKAEEELRLWIAKNPLSTPAQRVERTQLIRNWRLSMEKALTLGDQPDPWETAFLEDGQ